MTRRPTLLLAFLVVSLPCAAASLEAGASSCGGDAYSSAEVTEGRPPRRGPLTAVPDTLCADLAAPRGDTRIEVYGVPGGSGGAHGMDAAADPYERRSRRGPRPPGPPRRVD